MEKKLPEFKPLPELGNVASNYMSAFNVGMNIYEALAYLQGYVQIAYTSLDDLIDDWNNFETYVTENINQIANEKTQEILQGWLDDGTLVETIKQSSIWQEKVDVTGDVMSGDLQFQENTGVYGTLHSGTKVNMISHSYTGTDDYTQIGDDNAQAVIHSENRPVWYDGSQNQDLLVEEDLNDMSYIKPTISTSGKKFSSVSYGFVVYNKYVAIFSGYIQMRAGKVNANETLLTLPFRAKFPNAYLTGRTSGNTMTLYVDQNGDFKNQTEQTFNEGDLIFVSGSFSISNAVLKVSTEDEILIEGDVPSQSDTVNPPTSEANGTQTNPIVIIDNDIAHNGYLYTYGKYYKWNNVLYQCKRTGESDGETIKLYYTPDQMVVDYFVVV